MPAGSVHDLVDAMRQVLQTPTNRLDEMGNIGRRRVLEMHDASKNARLMLELLESSITR